MKKIFLLILLCLCFIIGCNKPHPNTPELLIKTYYQERNDMNKEISNLFVNDKEPINMGKLNGILTYEILSRRTVAKDEVEALKRKLHEYEVQYDRLRYKSEGDMILEISDKVNNGSPTKMEFCLRNISGTWKIVYYVSTEEP